MIDIRLLGSGGGLPLPDRFLSSVVMNYQGRNILMDCGEGTQVAMRKVHSGFKSIDIICISHSHGDHIFGLPGLLSTMGNSHRTEDVKIIGPKGIKEIVNGFKTMISYLPYKIQVIEVAKAELSFTLSNGKLKLLKKEDKSAEDIIMSTMELDHSIPCIGYSLYIPRKAKFDLKKAVSNNIPKKLWRRLQNLEIIRENGKIYEPSMVLGEKRKGLKLSYVTDTRPIEAIVDFIYDSDLLICEGTYGDNKDIHKAIEKKHMTFAETAELAKEGKVRELLITHFSSSIDKPEIYKENAREIFENTIIGYDGLLKSLNFRKNS